MRAIRAEKRDGPRLQAAFPGGFQSRTPTLPGSRCWSVLLPAGLLLVLAGCPGKPPARNDDKPPPAAEEAEPKPAAVEQAAGKQAAAETGTAVAFGVGVSTNRDPAVAARQATAEALEKLGVPAKGIVFCAYFPSATTASPDDADDVRVGLEPKLPDPQKDRTVLPAIRQTAGAVPTIGCRAQALVRDGSMPDDTVAVLAIGGDDVSCCAAKAELAGDRKAVATAIAKGLAEVDDLKLAVLFSEPGLAYNEKPEASVDDFVCCLSEAAGKSVVLLGGLALPGGNSDIGRGGVFLGDKPLEGHVVALGIGGPIGVHAAADHEFQPAETTCKVTGADGDWVEQLDGQPAAKVYRQIRGMEPDDEFTRNWQHPVGLLTGPGEVCPRMVLEEDKSRGALRFVAPIAPNTEVKVMYGGGDAQAILDSTGRAVGHALEKLGDAEPLAMLLIEAEGRSRRLREFLAPDASAAEETVAENIRKHQGIPRFGLATAGQFGPGPVFRQQAVVSVVVCEQE